MKTKRLFQGILFILFSVLFLSACEAYTSVSLTFSVETGDNIKITLNTKNGYSLSQENGTFIVKKDDTTILQGIFLTQEMYDGYLNSIKTTEDVTILEESTQDENDYIFYQFDGEAGMESTFLLKIKNSDTGLLTSSLSSQEDTKAAFEMLHFEKTN